MSYYASNTCRRPVTADYVTEYVSEYLTNLIENIVYNAKIQEISKYLLKVLNITLYLL